MRKQDELDDPRSCLNKAGPDEPLFVLRAHDIFAPDTVRAWISAVKHGYFLRGLEISDELAEKLEGAEGCATLMEAWPTRKAPD